MILRPVKRVPLLLSAIVIGLTLALRILRPDLVERIEHITYDLRVRAALAFPPPVATNLGFVYIDEATIRAVASGEFGYKYGLYWPRQVYGRAVQELVDQGVRAIAFDVVFGELRYDHPLARLPTGDLVESDEYFARQMRQAGNVILAVTPDVDLPGLFRTNAAFIADITSEKDSDGVLRRVRAFRDYRKWHPLFLQAAHDPELGIQLDQARVEPRRILLPRLDGSEVSIPLDVGGNFEVADFIGEDLPAGMASRASPFTTERVWHMGVVLAAQALDLDLSRADVDLTAGRIVLTGDGNTKRVLPVDQNGCFLIDWCVPPADARLAKVPFHLLLARNHARSQGEIPRGAQEWSGRLAVIGSAVAGGNDLTDRGATPLQSDTLLVSKHWNVANSIITGRFVRQLPLMQEILLVVFLGVLSASWTWRMRALPGALGVAGLVALFIAAGFLLYVRSRLWIPLVLPTTGAILANWACLTAWRVVFEQTERRRVKSVFSKIVSPNVVNELLEAETLALGGARREVSILFSDLRGFTNFTDVTHEQAEACVRDRQMNAPEAVAYVDCQAREALNTVNLYLARVADMVKRHDGTLDKYIGDCVMAFWGAPTPNRNHASSCVRAAIDAHRAVEELNDRHRLENRRIDEANERNAAVGQPAKSRLPLLDLGTGINTGMATVGLMGSDAHILNYTVFGREVNVASRLEGVSGSGRIIISQATHDRLQQEAPELAARCVPLPPADVKGIREAVQIYEVPWRDPAGD